MASYIEDHQYVECGLSYVVLHAIKKFRCERCGSETLQIPQQAQLHRSIADAIVSSPSRLGGPEIKFLRSHLGWSNQQFARMMGVSEEAASRWASGTATMGGPSERLLKMLAAIGPIDQEFEDFEDQKSAHLGMLQHAITRVFAMLAADELDNLTTKSLHMKLNRDWAPQLAAA